MVKYKVNQKDTSVNGTSLKGYLETTYDRLVELFGEPKKGSADGKTTCEWLLEFEDGTVATIHDWKVESTPKNLYNWSVGGHSYKVLDLLANTTNLKTRILEF
jgi:predicted dehydrogenase